MKFITKKKAQWGSIWKSIRLIDKDSNGFLLNNELEEIFKEHFPYELEDKSLKHFFHKFASIQNKQLIDYRKIKAMMNEKIMAAIEEDDELKIEGSMPALAEDDRLSNYSKASKFKNIVVNSKMINREHRSLTPIMFDQKGVNISASFN